MLYGGLARKLLGLRTLKVTLPLVCSVSSGYSNSVNVLFGMLVISLVVVLPYEYGVLVTLLANSIYLFFS